MNPVMELDGIVAQLRHLLKTDMDMGFDPPRLSAETCSQPVRKKVEPETLEELRECIGDCKRCKLSSGRNKLVFGEGDSNARLVFIGEGPGRDEDREGRPFVGAAGKLLTRIIEQGMGLKREDVYICNVVKCRPPNNRDPEADEVNTCIGFLKQQIKIIKPDVICCLGRIAGREIAGKDFRITRDRGKWLSFMDIPVMPTFHPAYILRNRKDERRLKAQVWEDIKKVMDRLGLGS